MPLGRRTSSLPRARRAGRGPCCSRRRAATSPRACTGAGSWRSSRSARRAGSRRRTAGPRSSSRPSSGSHQRRVDELGEVASWSTRNTSGASSLLRAVVRRVGAAGGVLVDVQLDRHARLSDSEKASAICLVRRDLVACRRRRRPSRAASGVGDGRGAPCDASGRAGRARCRCTRSRPRTPATAASTATSLRTPGSPSVPRVDDPGSRVRPYGSGQHRPRRGCHRPACTAPLRWGDDRPAAPPPAGAAGRGALRRRWSATSTRRSAARQPTGARRCSSVVRATGTTTAVVDRLVHLVETEGLDQVAELWAGAPAGLAGRLPVAALPAAHLGVRRPRGRRPASSTSDVGTPRCTRWSPASRSRPGPTTCSGSRTPCCAASGSATSPTRCSGPRPSRAWPRPAAPTATTGRESTYPSDISASRLMTMAEQLEAAARLELEGRLG